MNAYRTSGSEPVEPDALPPLYSIDLVRHLCAEFDAKFDIEIKDTNLDIRVRRLTDAQIAKTLDFVRVVRSSAPRDLKVRFTFYDW